MAFAQEGAWVAALGRNVDGLSETRVLAAEDGVDRVREFRCDVCDEGQVTSALAAVTKEFGPPEIVINNAGARQQFAGLTELSREVWDQALEVNLTSAMLVTRAVLGTMFDQARGCFVNIGSVAGTRPIRRTAAYSVAKSGLHALTRAVADEGAAHGVRANVIAPGWIETAMNYELRNEEHLRTSFEAILEAIPLHRFGVPADISSLALFLASPRSAYITGQVYHVDGGLS